MESCAFTAENAETLANMLAVVLVANVFIGAFAAALVVQSARAFIDWRAARKALKAG